MPVEITDFCWKYNLQRLQKLPEVQGCEAKLRHNADGTPYVTDNKNYIVDLYFKTPIKVCACFPCCHAAAHTQVTISAPWLWPRFVGSWLPACTATNLVSAFAP